VFSPSGQASVMPTETVATPILWTLIVGLLLAEWLYRQSAAVRRRLQGEQLPAIAGRYALFAAIAVSTGVSQLDGARPFIYFQF
jgi:hypothetical protein